jgi:hypothetical protein
MFKDLNESRSEAISNIPSENMRVSEADYGVSKTFS